VGAHIPSVFLAKPGLHSHFPFVHVSSEEHIGVHPPTGGGGRNVGGGMAISLSHVPNGVWMYPVKHLHCPCLHAELGPHGGVHVSNGAGGAASTKIRRNSLISTNLFK